MSDDGEGGQHNGTRSQAEERKVVVRCPAEGLLTWPSHDQQSA